MPGSEPVHRQKATNSRGPSASSQSSCVPAWPGCGGCQHAGDGRFRSAQARNARQNERPVRGDNRTGQAIWALGVDGRSRQIQPRWGGITAPTSNWSRQGCRTFKTTDDFFNSFGSRFGGKIIARRGGRARQQPTCQTPWLRQVRPRPWSREPVADPKLFRRQERPWPPRRAPP